MQALKDFTKTTRGKIIAAVFVLFAFCMCCGITSLVIAPPESAAPTLSEDQIRQTAEAIAWAPFTQTAAAIPTQTLTPVPTQTPEATPTSDIYRQELNRRMLNYIDAFNSFIEVSTEASENTAIIFDENWKIRAAATLAVLDVAATELENIPGATAQYEKIDGYMKAIAQETHLLVKNYASGIDNLDVNALNRAVSNIELITEYTILATEEIKNIP